MRPKLTYANVVATLALFIAIGGTTAFAASQLGKNTVGTKQLKKNAVTTAKIKKGAVTGAKISASTFGTVPSAVNAQMVGGLSTTQLAEASKVRCPPGTKLAVGVCFENARREADTLNAALEACGHANLRLPLQGELIAFQEHNVTTPSEYEWAEPYYLGAGNVTGTSVLADSKNVSFTYGEAATKRPYRCVTPATN